jgi:membrane protein implicated in regulation of membrane protease activity
MSSTPTSRQGHHRLGAGIALVFCLGCAVLSLWIALTGQPVTGGLPFLPHAWNQGLGRVVFAVSGLVCLALGRLALRDVVRQPPRAPVRDETASRQP